MYLSKLYPTPKAFSENEDVRFTFGSAVTARVSGLKKEYADIIKTLWYRFSCSACSLELVSDEENAFYFIIGNARCSLNDNDEYAISVDDGGVCAVGMDAEGLFDGIKTLVQLICPVDLTQGREAFYISAAEIHDAPAIGFRALEISVFPKTTLYSLEQAIHMAGFLKFTHIVLEFLGVFPFSCRPELCWSEKAFSKDDLRSVIKLAQNYGLEIIPMFNHFGHATQSRGCHGRHTILNSNPRLSRLFEPDGWTWCSSNPDTYKLLAEVREELMEFCGEGRYFQLGFDEALSFATCDICRRRVPDELLSEYLNRLTEDLIKSGRRPIIWHDELIRRDAFGEGLIAAHAQNHGVYNAIDMIDKRIIIADWQYNYKNGFNPTTPYFMEKGFDTIVCPWDNYDNIKSLSSDAKKLGTFGIIMTTWHHLPSFLHHGTSWANCIWMEEGTDIPNAPITDTESACLLRRLYDADGSFDKSGWSICEFEC